MLSLEQLAFSRAQFLQQLALLEDSFVGPALEEQQAAQFVRTQPALGALLAQHSQLVLLVVLQLCEFGREHALSLAQVLTLLTQLSLAVLGCLLQVGQPLLLLAAQSALRALILQQLQLVDLVADFLGLLLGHAAAQLLLLLLRVLELELELLEDMLVEVLEVVHLLGGLGG